MDLISENYKSDEETKEKNGFSVESSVISVSLAPAITEMIDSKEAKYYDESAVKLYDNPTFDILNAPVKGPKLLNKKVYENNFSTLTGHVEDYSIDPFSFEEQFHTYKNYGYAKNPADPINSSVVGNKKNFKSFDGSTVFSQTALKKKKYKKPKREKMGDSSNPDGYKGPWAKFEEDEGVVDEMRERQLKMKEMFEKEKKGEIKKNQPNKTEKEDSKGEKSDNKEDENKDAEKIKSDCAKESTVFEYVQELDYLGRSYMHCPHEFRNKEKNYRSYIPTKRVHTWHGHTGPVSNIRFFPKTGHILLSASMDKSLKIWDVNQHRRCLRTMNGHNKGVRDIEFSGSGDKFISVSHDQWIKIWDTETGQVVSRFNSGVNPLTARLYPMNENEFLAGQSNKLIVCWDCRQKEIVQKYDDHQRAVNAVVFIDQNRKFVSSSDDKKLLIWEYGIPVVMNHISEPYMSSMPFLTLSPDGGWFLGQSMDNSVIAYSYVENVKRRKRRYIGHSSYGHACQVDVSPDGKFIVSGDSEGKVFFWDWKTKKIYKRLKAHDKVAIGAIWHPVHPSKVATCGWDCTIKYWD